jgi:hypothetical protein
MILRQHNKMASNMSNRNKSICAFLLLIVGLVLCQSSTIAAYQIYVPNERNFAGSSLFQSQLATHQFRWSLHTSHDQRAADKWLRLNPTDGILTLETELQCAGSHLWSIVQRPLQVTLVGRKYALDEDSAEGLHELRIPIQIWFDHHTCQPLHESTTIADESAYYSYRTDQTDDLIQSELKANQTSRQNQIQERLHRLFQSESDAWPLHYLEHIELNPLPAAKLNKLLSSVSKQQAIVKRSHSAGCLQQSQFVASTNDLIPKIVLDSCQIQYHLLQSHSDHLEDQLHFFGQPSSPHPPSFAVQSNVEQFSATALEI